MSANREELLSLNGETMPREQLERAPSAAEVPSAALLAVVLRTGAEGCDVLELSRRILEVFGGDLARLTTFGWRELEQEIKRYNKAHPKRALVGFGHVKALELTAAFELARRGLRHAAPDWKDLVLTADTAAKAYDLFYGRIVAEKQEHFMALPVDARHHPLSDPIVVSKGTADMAPVHPREVFREAIRWSAHAVVVAHNHPDGDPEPSGDDIDLTARLVAASRQLAIPLLDHLVLGAPGRFTSIRSRNPSLFTPPASL